jgi:acetolactate synthase-1/3 small subunit
MTTATAPSLAQPTTATPALPAVHTLSVYVSNKPGVLARIAQCFARRGFNIESLVVSPAMDGHFSRMTIGVSGNPDGLEQIMKQVSKLIDVLRCTDHTGDDAVTKELAMVKVGVNTGERSEALQIGEHFGCKNVDLTETSMILMCTGNSEKIDALIRMLAKFRIIELVRTGKVVMARGEELS